MYRILVLSAALFISPAWALDYPESRRDKTVDVYHEISVADPYQWLEDWSATGVKTWSASQNTLALALGWVLLP